MSKTVWWMMATDADVENLRAILMVPSRAISTRPRYPLPHAWAPVRVPCAACPRGARAPAGRRWCVPCLCLVSVGWRLGLGCVRDHGPGELLHLLWRLTFMLTELYRTSWVVL